MTVGLLMLLKESIPSGKKAIGEILQLQEDKAKLYHELDLLRRRTSAGRSFMRIVVLR